MAKEASVVPWTLPLLGKPLPRLRAMKRSGAATPAPAGAFTPSRAQKASRVYRCRCGQRIFFDNSLCLACGTPLGYEPERTQVFPLEQSRNGVGWNLVGPAGEGNRVFNRCLNFQAIASCNWLVDSEAPGEEHRRLCRSCRLTRTIPDLSIAENGHWWAQIEAAKRRLVSSLIAMGLPLESLSEEPSAGLAFDFIRGVPGGPRVMTGHDDGVITLNIEEADDARRESIRASMHERYRTLLGHLRHEVGHYYWQRLVEGTAWHQPYRQLFGDEREDYSDALHRHYRSGPAANWALRHVSSYASAHSWEDWAETWAHYLHMVDTLDTALSFGVDAGALQDEVDLYTTEHLYGQGDPAGAEFVSFVNAWVALTGVLNELSRSMGQPDFYPLVLPAAAVTKLHFIHLVVADSVGNRSAISNHTLREATGVIEPGRRKAIRRRRAG